MPSKKWGFLIAIALFVVLELFVRIFPIYQLEQPEIFFVNLKRKFVESGQGKEEVIILGDSRSMALAGYTAKLNGEYSVYNHSLPAMGPKYYKAFIQKYLNFSNKKPKLILFAASPLLYSQGYGPPLYDPSGAKTKQNESLSEYFTRRIQEGIERNIFATGTGKLIQYSGQNGEFEQLLWEFFGHRFLHQFSISELWNQYQGVERLFIIAKAIPLVYQSYRFHGAIRNASSLENWKVSGNFREKVEFCQNCANVEAGLCLPPSSQREDNLMIAETIERFQGKYNISNRIKPQVVVFSKLNVSNEFVKNTEVEKNRKDFLEPNFIVLKDLIAYTKEKGISFGFIYMPWIDLGEAWPETQFRKEKLKAFLQAEGIPLFQFPKDSYPSYQFVDKIHYDCQGEARLNQEFREFVLPEIFRFLQKSEKSN